MSKRPVTIITGASSGIGKETALAFARKGHTLVLAARREQRLDEVAEECNQINPEIDIVTMTTDVAQREQVDKLINDTYEMFGRIDVLVNNAGRGHFGRLHETSEQDMRDIFEVNFYGTFYGCKAVAPIMIRQRFGHIFNVSSVIGKRGTPFHGAYCATKFAVVGMTESMRVELKPHNVNVTCVCPTLTATEFFDTPDLKPRTRSKYVNPAKMMPASTVGKKIAATVGKKKPQLVFSFGANFLLWLNTIWPKAADFLMKYYHDDLAKQVQADKNS